ncbi:B12-binding domain-containing radical SAM protein [Bradyrhizobium lablabi]|uniref:B12-binding domain-containing radical SAM protein n=1 Tax=Bradyrhizobium lablabi TaxID=722472 RepID=UPI001BA56033|nr:radical SAM protein [Bradyrhizobium lablabi]MBR0697143.1 B12-binding domain-containing radical SAM protein [Bradyrhizobium lablabi]
MTSPCRVLMIYPKFITDSFWNYTEACELVGAKYPAAPLGLITVAAMLPKHWDIRLVNRNTEPLTDADLNWADLVMIGGMLNQQPDFLYLIDLAHLHGKPVCVGGPDVSSSPHLYADADFQVIGEAEQIMEQFIAAWERGERKGVFIAEKFKIDVTQSPMPRYDLIKFDQYLFIGVQYSRGCPFTCEFCDIIELYGRVPRTKTNDQILAELQALYDHGYRGHVDFVDDNFIGNKRNLRTLLPRLKAWLEERDYPFEFSTEASINIADDSDLLQAMKDANFFGIFVGIESPDPETLVQMKKKQNTRRNIAECIHKIYSYGMFVTAGFIVGFDTEKVSMGQAMIDFIDEASIPVCMVGLLYALPGTQLTRRLAAEGRLHEGHDLMKVEHAGDQCTLGCNFDTVRPLRDILEDYKTVLGHVFSPTAYAARLSRLAVMLDRSDRRRDLPDGDVRKRLAGIEGVHKVMRALPEVREPFWKTFVEVAKTNPNALRYIVMLMALYMHLGPFSKRVISQIERRIAELDRMPAVTADGLVRRTHQHAV